VKLPALFKDLTGADEMMVRDVLAKGLADITQDIHNIKDSRHG